jgi:hypothetical protein
MLSMFSREQVDHSPVQACPVQRVTFVRPALPGHRGSAQQGSVGRREPLAGHRIRGFLDSSVGREPSDDAHPRPEGGHAAPADASTADDGATGRPDQIADHLKDARLAHPRRGGHDEQTALAGDSALHDRGEQ